MLLLLLIFIGSFFGDEESIDLRCLLSSVCRGCREREKVRAILLLPGVVWSGLVVTMYFESI